MPVRSVLACRACHVSALLRMRAARWRISVFIAPSSRARVIVVMVVVVIVAVVVIVVVGPSDNFRTRPRCCEHRMRVCRRADATDNACICASRRAWMCRVA
eukprot:2259930-Alexandrium_andersonii.AAC.1